MTCDGTSGRDGDDTPGTRYFRPELESPVARRPAVFRRPEVVAKLVGCELGPGWIRLVTVEAYGGPEDSASHARFGRTARNETMFGPPAASTSATDHQMPDRWRTSRDGPARCWRGRAVISGHELALSVGDARSRSERTVPGRSGKGGAGAWRSGSGQRHPALSAGSREVHAGRSAPGRQEGRGGTGSGRRPGRRRVWGLAWVSTSQIRQTGRGRGGSPRRGRRSRILEAWAPLRADADLPLGARGPVGSVRLASPVGHRHVRCYSLGVEGPMNRPRRNRKSPVVRAWHRETRMVSSTSSTRFSSTISLETRPSVRCPGVASWTRGGAPCGGRGRIPGDRRRGALPGH